ncbi:hypothetical protein [Klebsiella pneumoniae]|uniref:hypothetical protein n=1 Tax=Klebsiella pneumoniae TaxID=573 RepID=UPI0021B07BB8|nr:hypothetical protein [Klebsiella pneumoniae]
MDSVHHIWCPLSSQEYQDLPDGAETTLTFIVYIVVGLFQLAAIMAGLESWWGIHWLIAAPVAFIISYIPLVGSIVGMIGAMDVWRWEWWQAGLLFFGGLVFAIACGGMSSFLEWLSFRKRV